MGLIRYTKNGWHTNPINELKASVCRENSIRYYKGLSIVGRLGSLSAIPLHLVGVIGGKSLIYLLASATHFAATAAYLGKAAYKSCKGDDLSKTKSLKNAKKHIIKSIGSVGCAAVAPLGQGARVIKAVAGIIHPAAYFKGSAASIEIIVQQGFKKFIVINRKETQKNPKKALHILSKNTQRYVRFVNERGVDGGGLTREFYNLIFSNLSHRLKLDEKILEWSAQNDQTLKEIGTVFSHLVKYSSGYYRNGDGAEEQMENFYKYTGEFFNPLYFKAIEAFAKKDYDQMEFDELNDEELQEVWYDIHRENLTEPPALTQFNELYKKANDGYISNQTRQLLTKCLLHLQVTNYYDLHLPEKLTSLVSCPIQSEADLIIFNDLTDVRLTENINSPLLKFNKTELDDLNKIIQDEWNKDIELNDTQLKKKFVLTEANRNQLRTIHTIVRAMSEQEAKDPPRKHNESFKSMNFKTLRESIQGHFNKEAFINIVRSTSDNNQALYVANWMEKKSDDQLKQFLLLCTGLTSVPTKLYTQTTPSACSFSTCGPIIYINENYTEMDIAAYLDFRLNDFIQNPNQKYNKL